MIGDRWTWHGAAAGVAAVGTRPMPSTALTVSDPNTDAIDRSIPFSPYLRQALHAAMCQAEQEGYATDSADAIARAAAILGEDWRVRRELALRLAVAWVVAAGLAVDAIGDTGPDSDC